MSKALEVPAPEEEAHPFELRRLRIDRWRVVYAVTNEDHMVDVLTIQKRPPYDYGDLSELIEATE
jgi:mRNA interferase RelE/StbE